ncbi:hypothetical protein MKK84_24525 [Methylobacterium sp. E-065]|uniref:hypothetical protein n=1 Tax=Methylobacterium sp. E-065 TaxID=2836583 RepID=UPI001FBC029F|nr:hypothetical protein [Methylobacterium sp. E-065]MCJ2020554.1 hypothetical protein [Methylobacterium sp. E-065]
MNASTLAFLAVPIATGCASALWSPITPASWNAMAALNAVTYATIWAVMTLIRTDDPGLIQAVRIVGWWPIAGYVALSIAVSTGWFVAHREIHVVWIAVGEMAWPACVLAGTLALARWTSLPVTAPAISLPHALWSALILAGVVGLAVTEGRS